MSKANVMATAPETAMATAAERVKASRVMAMVRKKARMMAMATKRAMVRKRGRVWAVRVMVTDTSIVSCNCITAVNALCT